MLVFDFKLTNSLLSRLHGEMTMMAFLGHSHKVNRPIVVSFPINMMHNPIFWKWPAVSIFPNQDMFTNITMMVASGMVRFKQKHITVRMFNPTTLPAIIKFWMNFYLNCIARFAKTRFIITRGINTLATINTKILYSAFSIAFPGAIYATFTTMCEFSPTLGTGNYMFCHIPILSNYNNKIKPTWWFGDRTVQHIKERKE